jgi:hypothetical protein
VTTLTAHVGIDSAEIYAQRPDAQIALYSGRRPPIMTKPGRSFPYARHGDLWFDGLATYRQVKGQWVNLDSGQPLAGTMTLGVTKLTPANTGPRPGVAITAASAPVAAGTYRGKRYTDFLTIPAAGTRFVDTEFIYGGAGDISKWLVLARKTCEFWYCKAVIPPGTDNSASVAGWIGGSGVLVVLSNVIGGIDNFDPNDTAAGLPGMRLHGVLGLGLTTYYPDLQHGAGGSHSDFSQYTSTAPGQPGPEYLACDICVDTTIVGTQTGPAGIVAIQVNQNDNANPTAALTAVDCVVRGGLAQGGVMSINVDEKTGPAVAALFDGLMFDDATTPSVNVNIDNASYAVSTIRGCGRVDASGRVVAGARVSHHV